MFWTRPKVIKYLHTNDLCEYSNGYTSTDSFRSIMTLIKPSGRVVNVRCDPEYIPHVHEATRSRSGDGKVIVVNNLQHNQSAAPFGFLVDLVTILLCRPSVVVGVESRRRDKATNFSQPDDINENGRF